MTEQAGVVPEKLYRVGEIAEHTGVSRQTIHNYTVWGLITEARRTRGNHRLYGEAVFGQLARIRELKRGHTLVEIRRMLNGDERGPLTVPPSGPSTDQIAR
jgi:DNA-binding transcriptional MerR regulator